MRTRRHQTERKHRAIKNWLVVFCLTRDETEEGCTTWRMNPRTNMTQEQTPDDQYKTRPSLFWGTLGTCVFSLLQLQEKWSFQREKEKKKRGVDNDTCHCYMFGYRYRRVLMSALLTPRGRLNVSAHVSRGDSKWKNCGRNWPPLFVQNVISWSRIPRINGFQFHPSWPNELAQLRTDRLDLTPATKN